MRAQSPIHYAPSTKLINKLRSIPHFCEYIFHRSSTGRITDMEAYALDFFDPSGTRIARIDYSGRPFATVTEFAPSRAVS
jgi:hypothetical protein